MQLAVALLDTSGTDMALYRDADMVRAIVWARRDRVAWISRWTQ
jgi:hypothetical protein